MELGLHHLHRRRRKAGPTLSPFDYLMYGVGLVQPLALIPQILQIYQAHSTAGVSFSTWALFTGFNALWAVYGIVHRDTPITLAYVLITILDGVIAVGILIY